jgi:hypothetical protein
MILTEKQVEDIKLGNGDSNWIKKFCESHEELRKERDELQLKIRRVLLERATIRETVCNDE